MLTQSLFIPAEHEFYTFNTTNKTITDNIYILDRIAAREGEKHGSGGRISGTRE